MNKEKELIDNYGINIIDLISVIWNKKWFLVKVMIASMICGLVIAFTSPYEYKTKVILMPEIKQAEGKLSKLGDLAGLAGLNIGSLNNSATVLNPGLYYQIARSTPFLMELLEKEYSFNGIDGQMKLKYYFINHSKSSLISKIIKTPFLILDFFKTTFVSENQLSDNQDQNSASLIVLSEKDEKLLEMLKERVKVEMDWEEGILNINVEMQDPFVAGQIASFTQEYIEEFVKQYYNIRTKRNLEYAENQYQEVKLNFERKQKELAIFIDQNANIKTEKAKSERIRLESEYDIAFNVYNSLAQSLEELKLELNEYTPVFKVIEPAVVKLDNFKPNKLLILLISLFLGAVIGVSIIVYRNFFVPQVRRILERD